MKILFKVISILTLFIFFSCQEEIVENNNNNDPQKTEDDQSLTQLKGLILNKNTTLKYPITLLSFDTKSQQSNNSTFENDNDLLAFLTNLKSDSSVLFTIKYPILFFDKNQNVISSNNNIDLEQNSANSINLSDWLNDIELNKLSKALENNLFFSYPLNLSTGLRNLWPNLAPNAISLSVNKEILNVEEFLTFLPKDTQKSIAIAFKYPLIVFNNNQEEISINNNTELFDFIDQSSTKESLTSEGLDSELLKKFIQYLNDYSGLTYPIKINQNINSETVEHIINNKDVFFNVIDIDNLSNLNLTLQYPIQIDDTTINNNTALNTYLTLLIDLADRLKHVSKYDGTFDDFIDNAPNFSLEFPYQVTIGNKTITLESENDYSEVIEEQNAQPNQQITIVLPVEVVGFHHVVNSIATPKQLQKAYDLSLSNENRARFSVYKIKYPIQIETTNLPNEFFTINEDTSLSFYAKRINKIKYPIQLESSNGIVTINNNQELVNTIESK